MPLRLDQDGTLDLEVTDFIGESTAILGIKGSGKSHTAGVTIEELILEIPMTILDIDGEYYGLKERFDILHVGDTERADLPIVPDHAAALATFSHTECVSVILDMSNTFGDTASEFLVDYFKAIFRVAGITRRPYHVVVEEAHEYVPQTGTHPVADILTRIALRGRKRGLGVITISQRSAKVNKDLLTQAGIVFLHRVVHPRDMSVYCDLLPLPKKEVESRVRELQTGQVLVMHNAAVKTATIRPRDTYHAGTTPGLDQEHTPELRKIDDQLLGELRTMLGATHANATLAEPSAIKKLETRVAELEQQLVEKDQEIEHLMERVAILSGISVQVETSQSRPDQMHVGAIHTRQIVSGNGQPADVHQQLELISDNQPALTYRTPLAIERAVKRQRRRFDTLLRDINRCAKHERIILSYFIERPELDLSVEELARFVGYSVSTLKSSPPTKLIRLGLLDRHGKRGKYRFKSKVTAYFSEHFPDLETHELEDQLLQKLVV